MNKIDREIEILKHINTPYKVGETVYVRGLGSQDKQAYSNTTEIIEVFEDGVHIMEYGSLTKVPFENLKKFVNNLGYNPFSRKRVIPRNINFPIDSILGVTYNERGYTNDVGVPISSLNWNPFVMIGGEKFYYQRDFVWELEDKQALITSICNEMDCGKIVVRKRDWSEVAKQTDPELCFFNDIVDGKQRLSTIIDFIEDKFVDANGYLFSEWSTIGQRRFLGSQSIGYAQFDGFVEDSDIIKQFLMVNHTGKPQSIEHIKYVESILNKFQS